MRIKSVMIGAGLALSLALASAPSLAGAARISAASVTPAPLGFQIFCMRTPQHCTPAPATQLSMDSQLMSVLDAVNRSVNAAIRPLKRPTQIWELGATAGDCKDYAMNKRAQLIARGVPPGALRLAIGYTAGGEGHAVLVVRTSTGDLVLDNLTNEIKPFNETGHTLVAIASNDPTQWTTIR